MGWKRARKKEEVRNEKWMGTGARTDVNEKNVEVRAIFQK